MRSWELAIDNVNLSAESEDFVGAEIKVEEGGGEIAKKDECPHKAQRFKAEARGRLMFFSSCNLNVFAYDSRGGVAGGAVSGTGCLRR